MRQIAHHVPMGFKPCFLAMQVPAEVEGRSVVEALPALLGRWAAKLLAPREVFVFDGVEGHTGVTRIDRTWVEPTGLWRGESFDDARALTVFRPDVAADRAIIETLRTALRSCGASAGLVVTVEGAMCLGVEGAAAWHGRWWAACEPPSSAESSWAASRIAVGGTLALHELVSVRIEWGPRREILLSFPLSGFPLTAVRPMLGGSRLEASTPEIARANCERIVTALADVHACFELPASVRWQIDGEFGALYPDDDAALRARLAELP